MSRLMRNLLSAVVVAGVVLAPTAAGAGGYNVAVAANGTDGAALVEASMQYRKTASKVVDEVNYARAQASCVDCQTVAVAFQLVLVTKDWTTFSPRNTAFAVNAECDECLTWASAKQVLVATGGPAELSQAGRARLRALETRVEAMEGGLATMTLEALIAELDAAYGELLAIADEEVVRTDGGQDDARVVATRST